MGCAKAYLLIFSQSGCAQAGAQRFDLLDQVCDQSGQFGIAFEIVFNSNDSFDAQETAAIELPSIWIGAD